MLSPNEQLLIARYPTLFHMAEDGSWPAIESHGLLSTSAVLDLCDLEPEERNRIERQRRPENVHLTSKVLGPVVVRDQKPLSISALEKCLDDMTPSDWIALLNQFVFFWPSEERLLRLLSARAYRDKRHTVLSVPTAEVLARHRDRVRLSPINSGSTIFNPARRGSRTFRPIPNYPLQERFKSHGKAAVAEFAVQGGVPDLAAIVHSVRVLHGPDVIETLFTR